MRVGILFSAALAVAGASLAEGTSLPATYQVPLMLKLVTYELNLMAKPEAVLRFGVLYRPEDPASRSSFKEIEEEFRHLGRTEVSGRRIELAPLPIAGDQPLRLPSGVAGIDVLYVTPGNEGRLESIIAWARGMKVLSVTADEKQAEQGLSIALVRRGLGSGVTLNLPASLEEGREWNVNILQIARVLRDSTNN